MEMFDALIIYAANIDNTALESSVRSYARECYNQVMMFEANKNKWLSTDPQYDAIVYSYNSACKQFIASVETMKSVVDAISKMADKKKVATAEDVFKTVPDTHAEGINVETSVITTTEATEQTGGQYIGSYGTDLSPTDASGNPIDDTTNIFDYPEEELKDAIAGVGKTDLIVLGAVLIFLFFVLR